MLGCIGSGANGCTFPAFSFVFSSMVRRTASVFNILGMRLANVNMARDIRPCSNAHSIGCCTALLVGMHTLCLALPTHVPLHAVAVRNHLFPCR